MKPKSSSDLGIVWCGVGMEPDIDLGLDSGAHRKIEFSG